MTTTTTTTTTTQHSARMVLAESLWNALQALNRDDLHGVTSLASNTYGTVSDALVDVLTTLTDNDRQRATCVRDLLVEAYHETVADTLAFEASERAAHDHTADGTYEPVEGQPGLSRLVCDWDGTPTDRYIVTCPAGCEQGYTGTTDTGLFAHSVPCLTCDGFGSVDCNANGVPLN